MKRTKKMKEYQKPELAVFSFLSKEAISESTLDDWLKGQDVALQDAPITAYSDTSLGI